MELPSKIQYTPDQAPVYHTYQIEAEEPKCQCSKQGKHAVQFDEKVIKKWGQRRVNQHVDHYMNDPHNGCNDPKNPQE